MFLAIASTSREGIPHSIPHGALRPWRMRKVAILSLRDNADQPLGLGGAASADSAAPAAASADFAAPAAASAGSAASEHASASASASAGSPKSKGNLYPN